MLKEIRQLCHIDDVFKLGHVVYFNDQYEAQDFFNEVGMYLNDKPYPDCAQGVRWRSCLIDEFFWCDEKTINGMFDEAYGIYENYTGIFYDLYDSTWIDEGELNGSDYYGRCFISSLLVTFEKVTCTPNVMPPNVYSSATSLRTTSNQISDKKEGISMTPTTSNSFDTSDNILMTDVKTTLEGKTAIMGAKGYYTVQPDMRLARCFSPLDNLTDIRTTEKNVLEAGDIILYEGQLAYVSDVAANKYEIVYFKTLKTDSLIQVQADGMTEPYRVIVNPIDYQLKENPGTTPEELLSTVESNTGRIMTALAIKAGKTNEDILRTMVGLSTSFAGVLSSLV